MDLPLSFLETGALDGCFKEARFGASADASVDKFLSQDQGSKF